MIIDNPIVSGSLNVQNDVTASNLAITSTASAAYFTGSFVGDGTQLSGVTSYTDADTLDYINSLGVLSGSAQIASDISGSFTSLSSSLEQRITNQENFSQSLDATFATDAQVTSAVSSLNAATSSYALKADISGAFADTSSSLAQRIDNISTDFDDITNKPTLISSSLQFNTVSTPFTGSFTGSFYGDGSNLSGVTSYTDADTLAFINSRAVLSGSIAELTSVTASFLNTGSVTIPHSFNSKNVSISVYDSNDILIIPQEVALISNSAVKLTFGGSTSGFAVVSKGGHIVSGSVPVPQLSTVTSAFTSTTSHTVTHNFNTKEVIVSVYENDSLIIPDTVTTDDVNNVTVTFPEAISGRVVVVKAGHIVSGSIPFDNLLDSPFVQSATAVTASKSIVPSQDITYDLGSSTLRFRDLYLSSASIYLGNTVISEDNVVTTASLATALPPGVMSGSNQMAGETIDGDLTITGTMTAKEFHTEYVSASIVYQSGSTKFGDTADDTHEFTGSVDISGSLLLTGGNLPALLTNIGSYFSIVSTGDTSDTSGSRIWLGNGQGDAGYYQNAYGHYFRDRSSNLQMYIDGTGNVGIGTNNPTTALHVQGEISIGGGESTDDARMYFKASDNSNRFTIETDLDGTTDNDILGFRTSAADNVLVLKGDGNVGIGTNNPLTKLHIDGTASPTIRLESTSGPYSLISSNTVGSVEIAADAGNGGTGTNINFKVDDYNVMRIASSGDQGKVGIGTTSPESNAKLDVKGNLLVGGGSTYAGTGVTSVTINNDLYPLLSLGSTSSNRMELIAYSSYNLFSSTNNFVFDTGNIGIGTQPSAKLDVVSTSAKIAEFERQGSANYDLTVSDAGAGAAQLWFNANTNNTGFVFRPKSSGGTQTNALLIDSNGNVGINATNPNASLHVNGGAHFGPDSGVLNPSTGQVLIETVQGGTPTLQFYPYNGSVMNLKSDGTTGVLGWNSGADREINILNEGAGKISVGIGTGAPSKTFHLYSTGNEVAFFQGGSGGAWIDFQSGTSNLWSIGAIDANAMGFYNRTTSNYPMVITNDGRIGIGTLSPRSLLHVARRGNVNGGTMLLGDGGSGTDKWSFLAGAHRDQATGSGNGVGSAGVALIGSYADSVNNNVYVGGGPYELNAATQILFNTHTSNLSTLGGTTRMIVSANGNVGIGTISPTAKLQVSGDLTVGSTSAETRVTVDGGVKAEAFWAGGNAGWLATWSPEGWETVVKTGSISSSSGTTSLDILSVYTDGHWGGSMFGEIWLYTSYYGAGIKKYTFKAARAGYAVVTLVDESGYEMAGTVDVHGQAVIGTGTHSGQSVSKSVIRMNTGTSYQNVYAIIKIGYSDNSRKIFDNRSTDGNVEADRITSGGCYHFRSVDLTGMPYVTTI